MNYFLIIYFIAGIIQDFLFTLNLKYVSKDKTLLAVISSFLTVLLSWIVFYNILTQLDSQRSIIAIVTYSVGIAVGTYLGMKFKFGLEKK